MDRSLARRCAVPTPHTSPFQFTLRFQLHLVAACAIFVAWCHWLPFQQGASRLWFPGWLGLLAAGMIVGSGFLPSCGRWHGAECAFAIGCLAAMVNFMRAQLTFGGSCSPTFRNIASELRYEIAHEAVCLGTLPLACALVSSYPAWCISRSLPDKPRRWLRLALVIALIDIAVFAASTLAVFEIGAELERAAVSQCSVR